MNHENFKIKIKEFIDISKEIIFESTNFPITKYTITEKENNYICNDIVILFGISGSIKGQVVFTMTTEAAIKIAAKIFEEIEITEFDDIAKCSISEFGNMVLGRAIQVFAEENEYVDITPPALAIGNNLQMHIDKMDVVGITYTLDDNTPFEINISLCEKN